MVASPQEFRTPVTLDAEVSSDGMHWTLLLDPASTCGRGIALSWDDGAPPQGSDRVNVAIWEPWPGTSNKKIRARFTGILRNQERDDGLFPYVFVVSRIDDLEIAIGQRPW
jgi:hypothetical protein